MSYINKLLYDEGYLKTIVKEKFEDESLKVHLSKLMGRSKEKPHGPRVPKFLFKLATHPWILPVSRRFYRVFFRNKQLTLKRTVDFEKSLAFIPTSESFGIYINIRDSSEKEKIVRKLISKLSSLEYSGRKVFSYVFRKEEVYRGPFIDLAPDILLLPNGFFVSASLHSDRLFEQFEPSSFHEMYGIFLAYGLGIKKGQRVDAKICDIAPTILHIFGLPVPNDMDGRVLMEIFEKNSEFAKRKPKYVDPSYYEKKQEDEKLKQTIKNLKLKGKI